MTNMNSLKTTLLPRQRFRCEFWVRVLSEQRIIGSNIANQWWYMGTNSYFSYCVWGSLDKAFETKTSSKDCLPLSILVILALYSVIHVQRRDIYSLSLELGSLSSLTLVCVWFVCLFVVCLFVCLFFFPINCFTNLLILSIEFGFERVFYKRFCILKGGCLQLRFGFVLSVSSRFLLVVRQSRDLIEN